MPSYVCVLPPAHLRVSDCLQWLLEAGALPKLMALLQDADGTCRRKALLAISCLIRQSAPAMTAFRLSGGVPRLISVSSDPDPRLSRYAPPPPPPSLSAFLFQDAPQQHFCWWLSLFHAACRAKCRTMFRAFSTALYPRIACHLCLNPSMIRQGLHGCPTLPFSSTLPFASS